LNADAQDPVKSDIFHSVDCSGIDAKEATHLSVSEPRDHSFQNALGG
jgi:hypothetical protein